MPHNRCSSCLLRLVAAVVSTTLLAGGASAVNKDKLLYELSGGTDGSYPYSVLVFDKAGNLYGTTSEGGGTGCIRNLGCGTVFELTPNLDGSWTESILYRFQGGSDGTYPRAGVILDQTGNLYGTTESGGGTGCSRQEGCGTVFERMPNPDGSWTERVLYRFGGADGDGYYPQAGVIRDQAGNLYGTTSGGGGGPYSGGTVFKLIPQPGGGWKERILHIFSYQSKDGAFPLAGVVLDKAGNLYGTTNEGGAYGNGTVFKVSTTGKETVLYTFGREFADGVQPWAGVVLDKADNLYGTTTDGGTGHGVVFEVKREVGGGWKESVLYNFTGAPDGLVPYAGLVFDQAGNLYGTTALGGAHNDKGTVFELKAQPGGGWTESVVYSFKGGAVDGGHPWAGVILDQAGNLYGTTTVGGPNLTGVVFEVTP